MKTELRFSQIFDSFKLWCPTTCDCTCNVKSINRSRIVTFIQSAARTNASLTFISNQNIYLFIITASERMSNEHPRLIFCTR